MHDNNEMYSAQRFKYDKKKRALVRQLDYQNNSYKPITNTEWVRARLGKLQKGCTRLAVASDKVYQSLAHGWWLSPGTPTSSTTKTGRHDKAEILLKVALAPKINQIIKYDKKIQTLISNQ